MKKIYLILLLCSLSFASFATKWTAALSTATNQVTAGSVCTGTSAPLSRFQIAMTSGAGTTSTPTLTAVTFSTTGTYVAADVTGYTLYYNTTGGATFSVGTSTSIATVAASGTGSKTFTLGTALNLQSNGTTFYFYIVANIAATGTATAGHTIAVSPVTAFSNLTISGTAPTETTGTATAAGTQTVAASPGAISVSAFSVCAGSTYSLTDATTGGTWSSGTSSVASFASSSSGNVTAVTGGTATIYYAVGSCSATATATVGNHATALNPTSASVCAGSTTTLSITPTTATGGTWSSAATGTASVSTAGVVKGVAAGGPVTISYITPGCTAVTSAITVNAVPSAITGNTVACTGGAAISLSSTPSGGTWSSVTTSVATVDGSGNITGLTQGTSVISYLVAGCAATTTASVSSTPGSITGGASVLCYGTTETLGETAAYGTWNVTGTTGTTVSTAKVLTAGTSSGLISVTYSNACGTSSAYTVQVGVPTASLPYTQGFESSWINGCNTADIPADGYWVNTPSTGNDSWRREDDADGSNTAGWTAPTSGQWWPTTTEGSNYGGASSSHAARFHTYEASTGTTGTLDLYVNMPTGSKQIAFDYTNNDADLILLQISTNNGASFTTLWTEPSSTSSWAHAVITTTLTATSAILRWSVTSDFGDYDQGIDNVSVAVVTNCTTAPTGVTTTASPSTYCIAYTSALALSGVPSATNGYTYQWKSGTGGTYTNISGATNASYTATVSATTNYECTIGCSFGGSPATSSTVTAAVTTDVVSTFPYTENFDEVAAPTMPCGWTVLDVNADGDTWETYDDEFDEFTGGSMPNYAECVGNFGAAAMNDWMISVPIATIAGYKYRLTFSYASEFDNESMSVYYGNNNTVAAMTHLLFSNGSFATEEAFQSSGNIDFTATTTGNIYYGFYVNTSAAADAEGVYIDNIEVQQIAPCTTPGAPTAVSCSVANGITTSVTCTPPTTLPDSFLIIARVATVTGAAPVPVTGVTYSVGASSSLGTGCYVIGYGAATSSSTTLLTYATAGLASNTAYNIYEYSYNDGLSGTCGGPAYSSTAGTTTFTTCVAGPAAPTTGGGTITPNFIPLSWTTVSGATGYTINGYTNSGGIGTPAITSGLLGSGVTTYTFTTGFSSGTTYYFFVTASTYACGAVSTGLAVPVPIAPPYFEGFETATAENIISPDGTQGNTATGEAYVYCCTNLGGTDDLDPIYNSTSFATEGPHHGTWQYIFLGEDESETGGAAEGNADSWLVGPAIYLTSGVTYTFSFWYITSYSDDALGTNSKWSLKAFLSNNGTLPSGTATAMSGTPVALGAGATGITTTNAWVQYTTTMSVTTSGTYYYGIDAISLAKSDILAIDDIAICKAVTGLTASASPNPVSSGCNDVNFTSTSFPGYTYSWSGGVTPSSAQSPSLNATFSSTATATAYTVTVSSDPASTCAASAAITLTVSPSASDSFSYAGNPYCSTATSGPVTIAGTTGGGFTSTPAGLSFSATTGAINPSLSTPGTYIITYSVAPAGCPTVSASQNVTINTPVYTNFTYPAGPFCTTTASISPTFTGSGVASLFSATPAGLSLTPSTGVIDISTSAGNTYTVTNTSTVGGCGTNSTTATVVVSQQVALTTQPIAASVLTTGNAVFSVVATGTGPLTYQWYENNGTTNTALTDGGTAPNYSGSATSVLTLSNCQASMNSYVYTCIISGASPCANVTTDSNGILSVSTIAYTLQPTNASLCPAAGSATATATFTSGITGGAPATDVWQENQGSGWNDLANGTVGGITYSGIGTGTLTLTGVSATNNGWQYRRNLNESSSPIISNVATLIVNTPISIVSAPVSTGICASASGTFSVSVTGTSPVYSWQVSTTGGASWTTLTDGGYYTGSSTNVLTVSNPVIGMNNYQYQCVVSGASPCSSVNSGTAILTVNTVASVTASPLPLSLCNTGLGSFNVTATGTSLNYSWYYSADGGTTYTALSDGGVYSGSSTSALTLNSPTTGMNGYIYRCTINGICNSVNSSPATLTVNTSPLSVVIATPAAVCTGGTATLTAVASCSPSTETQTILGMNFSGGTGTGSAALTGQTPVGGVWTVTSTNPTQTSPWTVYANGTGFSEMVPATCSPGTNYAGVVTNGGSTTLTSYLTSPAFSIPAGTTGATLSFNQFYYYFSTDVIVAVQITTNGGTTWTTMINDLSGSSSIGSATSFSAASANLLSYASAGSTAQIRFAYKSDNGYQWCINAVQVVATVTPVFAYTWSGPGTIVGGTTLTAQVTPTVTTGTSVYNLVFSASNFTACNATGTATVTDVAQPTLTYTATPSTICAGGTISTATTPVPGTGTLTYAWAGPGIATVTGSAVAPTSFVPTVTSSPGVFTVTAKYSGAGCIAASYTQSVTVDPVLSVTATNNGPVCPGGTFNLTGTATGGDGATYGYSWLGGAGSGVTSPVTTASLTASPTGGTGSYVYTLSVTSPLSGCNAVNAYTTATVSTLPTVNITSASPSVLCAGTSTLTPGSVTGGVGSLVDYVWTSSDGSLSTTTTTPVVATPTATTTYSVTVNTSGSGCIGTVAGTNVVTVVPTPVVGSLTLTPASGVLCTGGVIGLSANSVTGGTGATTYTWNGPGMASTTTSAPSLTYTTSGTATGAYSVALSSAGEGCGTSPVTSSTSYTIIPQPTVTLSVSAASLCSGNTETLTATPSGGTGTPQYTFSGPGISGSAGPYSSAIYTVTPLAYTVAPYAVSVSFTGGTGCNIASNMSPSVTVHNLQHWMGGVSSSWSNAANWGCGIVPTATQNIIIPGATSYTNAPTLDVSSAYGSKLTVSATGVLTLGTGNQLYITDTLNNSGTIGGGGAVNMNGTTPQIIKGTGGSVSNLTLSNSAGVTINSTSDTLGVNGELLLSAGTLNTNGTLMLLSDSCVVCSNSDSLINGYIGPIASGAGISGQVVVQQFVPRGTRAYRFIAHPFTSNVPLSQIEPFIDITGPGGVSEGFTGTITNAASAFWYNPLYGNSVAGSDPGWRSFKNTFAATGSDDTDQINRFEGLRLFVRGSKGQGLDGTTYIPNAVTYRTYGTVNTGTVYEPMVMGTASVTGIPSQRYNLLGNPYPAVTDIGSVISAANTAGKIYGADFYVWNPYIGPYGNGAFVAIPVGITPYYLGANESFEVQTTGSYSLVFTESNKGSVVNAALMRTTSDQSVALNVYDASYHLWDMLTVQFNDAATDNEDAHYDGSKPPSPQLFSFYSLSADSVKLAVDSRPFSAGKVIPLGMASSYAQPLIIKAENVSVPAGGQVYLHDKLLETYTLLQTGTEYKFSITKDAATQGNKRFELSMNPTGVNAAVTSNKNIDVQMLPNPASSEVTINYSFPSKGQTAIHVMNVEGVTVLTQNLGVQQSGSAKIALDKLASGVYIVEITSGNDKVSNRLIKE